MGSTLFLLLGFIHFLSMATGEQETNKVIVDRQGKVFSLFAVVQFKNLGCQSTDSLSSSTGAKYRNGTCVTSQECASRGGESSGNCAAGFGVCCLFQTTTCGSTVSQNCTYVKNPGYPSSYNSATACSFNIRKCSDNVCMLRLDFEEFTIAAGSDTNELTACTDKFDVTASSSISVPTICGVNAGQHMYIDMGDTSGASATLAFTFSSASSNRKWDIKVTQIECGSESLPPSGCLQYHTDLDGRFRTFNFEDTTYYQHLPSQQYQICIRQEKGYCCIAYQVCTDTNSFNINPGPTADTTKAHIDTLCTEDYITLEGTNGLGNRYLTTFNRYCGGILAALDSALANDVIRSCNSPWAVGIRTDSTTDGTASTKANGNRGVCLTYTQEPCLR